jgi:2-polyprenyl-3-methyl-5-hydroxy-6-metoxy-1,4-benzoquinol methylase
VQKVIDQKWYSQTRKIYSEYSIYHQSGGKEQAVFARDSGKAFARSERVLEYVKIKISLSSVGRYLDFGCGNGEALRSFARLLPRWALVGTELNNRYKRDIENISKNASFYACPLSKIKGTFDLITMFHVLEHVINPINLLREIKSKLSSKGRLVIDIPDYCQNPFDLFITDHCSHFTLETCRDILLKAGFEMIHINTHLIQKELVIIAKVAKKGKNGRDRAKTNAKITSYNSVIERIEWAKAFLEEAKKISLRNRFGVFGTSIIATWLQGKVGGRVKFFVDEDPSRYGKKYMNLPVYHPQNVPKGSNVFLAFPLEMAKEIYKRLPRAGVKFYLPPPSFPAE